MVIITCMAWTSKMKQYCFANICAQCIGGPCIVSFAHCMHLGNCFETQIELHLSCCIDLEQLLCPGLHENLKKLQPA